MSFAREFGHSLWTDILYGARMLRRNRSVTAVALLSLTIGIGASTATFSAAKRLLYGRLNVPRPQELRILHWIRDEHVVVHTFLGNVEPQGTNVESGSFSFPVYKMLQRHLAALFAFSDFDANATINGTAEQVKAVMVSGNYYSSLEVVPQIGRAIQNTDAAKPGGGAVAVISDELWHRDFVASPRVIGQTIVINRIPFTVIGVNPRGFTGTASVAQSPAIFLPLSMQPEVLPGLGGTASALRDANLWWVSIMARMAPEIKDARASAALDVELASAVRATMTLMPGDHIPRLLLILGSHGLHRIAAVKKPLNVMAAMLLLVLLLACANVATLLLARASERQREIGIRLALGANRRRLIRQSLTESMLLAFLGGAGGLLLGYSTRNLIPRLLVDPESMPFNVPFDWRVYAFVATVTIGTGMFFGWVPAMAVSWVEPATSLKETAHTASRRRGVGSKAIVGIQLALAACLSIGAGLFLRTVISLTSVHVGFNAEHLLLLQVNPPSSEYTLRKKVQLYKSLEDAFSAVPGVKAVTAMSVPFVADWTLNTMFETEAEAATQERQPGERITAVGNSFFQTMGIPIVTGRGFTERDTATGQPVAVINSSLAHRRFPKLNPIGQRFRFGIPIENKWVEVVGLCGDTRYMSLREPEPPQFFVPYAQRPEDAGVSEEMTYAVRTGMKTSIILRSLRRAAAKVDPNLPVANVRTQQQQIDESMHVERAFGALTLGFALMALILASIGVYGTMTYSVASRTKDLSIRLVLGAQPREIRSMILRESGLLAMVSISIGVVSALVLTRLIRSMLYAVSAHDPATIVGAVLSLLAIAVTAAWVPARRAASIQPVQAIRQE